MEEFIYVQQLKFMAAEFIIVYPEDQKIQEEVTQQISIARKKSLMYILSGGGVLSILVFGLVRIMKH